MRIKFMKWDCTFRAESIKSLVLQRISQPAPPSPAPCCLCNFHLSTSCEANRGCPVPVRSSKATELMINQMCSFPFNSKFISVAASSLMCSALLCPGLLNSWHVFEVLPQDIHPCSFLWTLNWNATSWLKPQYPSLSLSLSQSSLKSISSVIYTEIADRFGSESLKGKWKLESLFPFWLSCCFI